MPVQPLSANISPELLRQQQVVNALCKSGIFHHRSRITETHISWVLLNGPDAYKIKKAVDLGFLNFSTLESRHFYCHEELRLNRRLAPDLYLGVVAISGSSEQPVLGDVTDKQSVVEYAVHMRRFAPGNMMDYMLARGLVTPAHIDKLASIIANFHNELPPAAANSPHCAISEIETAAEQNFASMQHLFSAPEDMTMLRTIHTASSRHFISCKPLFQQRAEAGYVRECHGDLHLGNIVLLNDMPTPFDGIEFNPALRWIDVISEIAFTVMDLLRRGQPQLAWRLLNAYLEITGDYQGCRVLHFYLAYRAMVRAKIAAIRASQRDGTKVKIELKSCRSYLKLAHSCLSRHRPVLIITHGLPGCGKSTFAQIALEKLGAIRIRSDVERKRLFGLSALADSKALLNADIYSTDVTRSTYARLYELARGMLASGFPVIVDAAFVLCSERENFHALAKDLNVPFVIASVQTSDTLLTKRLELRSREGHDASEADVAVLNKLRAFQEPLSDAELDATVIFTNNSDIDTLRSDDKAWKMLDARLA